MIAGLKPYPAMKDSGVPWLGDVPEHWAIERLKSSMTNVIEQTAERQGTDLYVALEHVESWTGRIRPAASDVSFDSQVKRFRAGDILFGKLRPYLAKVTRPRNSGVCVGEFFVLRPHHSRATPAYIEQLLRSKPIIDAINSSTFGAKMPRADWHFVGGMAVTFPPLSEQAAIVRFLDYADRRTRRYIRAKQKLIKLLEEQKQAIIHRTVTRGLDPSVRLKPSGVGWLGDVPEHWEFRSLASVAESIQTGPFGSQVHASDYVTAGVPLINPAHMQDGQIVVDRRVTVTPDKAVELGRHQLRSGDLVAARRGELGRCVLVTDNEAGWLCGTGSIRIRPRKEIVEPAYLMFAFSSRTVRDFLVLASIGATMDNLSGSVVARVPLHVPPVEEQAAIVKFVESKSRKVDVTVAQVKREVDLLREFRTRLIADVVTGKLDVREAAARLPDESEEPEPLDAPDALTDAEDAALDDLGPELEEAEV